MATQVQLRRGTTAENDAFTGAQGEVTVDVTKDTLRVHDGSQAGGYELAKSDSQAHTNVDINSGTIDNTAIGGTTPAAGTFTTLNTTGAVVFNEAGADVDFRVEGDAEPNLLFVDAGANRVDVGGDLRVVKSTGTSPPDPSIIKIQSSTNGSGWSTGTTNPWGSIVFLSSDTSGGSTGAPYVHARINCSMADSSGVRSELSFFTKSNNGEDLGEVLRLGESASGVAGTSTFYSSLNVNKGATINESGNDNDFRVESDGNSNMLFVDAANNRVGIGTGTPTNGTLDVSGSIACSGAFTHTGATRTGATNSGFTTGQTITITVPANGEGHVYQVVCTRHTGTSSRNLEVGYVAYSSSGSGSFVQVLNGSGISISVSGADISATNTGSTATMRMSINRLQ